MLTRDQVSNHEDHSESEGNTFGLSNPVLAPETTAHIFKFLSAREKTKNILVSSNWKEHLDDKIHWSRFGFKHGQEFRDFINRLPINLRWTIDLILEKFLNKEIVVAAADIMLLPASERLMAVYGTDDSIPPVIKTYSHWQNFITGNSSAIVAILNKNIKHEDFEKLPYYQFSQTLSTAGVNCLLRGFIDKKNAFYASYPVGFYENLSQPHVQKAISNGILSLNQILTIRCPEVFCQPFVLSMLEKDEIDVQALHALSNTPSKSSIFPKEIYQRMIDLVFVQKVFTISEGIQVYTDGCASSVISNETTKLLKEGKISLKLLLRLLSSLAHKGLVNDSRFVEACINQIWTEDKISALLNKGLHPLRVEKEIWQHIEANAKISITASQLKDKVDSDNIVLIRYGEAMNISSSQMTLPPPLVPDDDQDNQKMESVKSNIKFGA